MGQQKSGNDLLSAAFSKTIQTVSDKNKISQTTPKIFHNLFFPYTAIPGLYYAPVFRLNSRQVIRELFLHFFVGFTLSFSFKINYL